MRKASPPLDRHARHCARPCPAAARPQNAPPRPRCRTRPSRRRPPSSRCGHGTARSPAPPARPDARAGRRGYVPRRRASCGCSRRRQRTGWSPVCGCWRWPASGLVSARVVIEDGFVGHALGDPLQWSRLSGAWAVPTARTVRERDAPVPAPCIPTLRHDCGACVRPGPDADGARLYGRLRPQRRRTHAGAGLRRRQCRTGPTSPSARATPNRGPSSSRRNPEKRIDILWHDNYARPNVVIIRNGSTWPVAVTGLDKPVAAGTTLEEIERMNGKPFTLTGFGWDLGGYTNGWDGGRLDKPGRRLQPVGTLRPGARCTGRCARQGERRRRVPVDRQRHAPDQAGRGRDRARLAAVAARRTPPSFALSITRAGRQRQAAACNSP